MLRRFCPHWFGWTYATHRRWCRLCGQPQTNNRGSTHWVNYG